MVRTIQVLLPDDGRGVEKTLRSLPITALPLNEWTNWLPSNTEQMIWYRAQNMKLAPNIKLMLQLCQPKTNTLFTCILEGRTIIGDETFDIQHIEWVHEVLRKLIPGIQGVACDQTSRHAPTVT